jgi:two-component system response regulator AtoC
MGELDSTQHQLTVSLSTSGPFALGLDERVSLLVYHRNGVEAVPLIEGQSVVVGRAAAADVTLPHASRLSRQHARFRLTEGKLWVEDLGSTNGTLVRGEQITRVAVQPGDEVVLGSVVVSVNALTAREGLLQGLAGHDRFVSLLDEEIVRHRTFGRSLALLLVQSAGKEPLSRWSGQVRPHLRPVDRLGVYSPTIMEVALPELTAEALRRLAEAIVASREKGQAGLVCGGALFPETGTSPEELVESARTALQQATARAPVQLAATRQEPASWGEPVVRAPAMRKVYEAVKRLATASIPVLIYGETGSGKEVVARAIHEGSPRAKRPLRCINCAAIPNQLLESIMFGHERGAFTGADRRTDGVFVDADGGTVLLDEVGELPAAAQAALLRVLETKRINRVGSSEEIEVDVRVLAATHRNLEAMCDAGGFRWDLLYRINTMTLKIPALRERREEIAPLARMFLEEANQANGCQVREIDGAALGRLEAHGWPGNVRELRNVIHRAVVMAQGDVITVADLPERLAGAAPVPSAAEEEDGEDLDFKDRVQRFETGLITRALQRAGGNKTEAAKLLRIPLRTLTHKIQAYGIDVPR